MSEYRFNVCAFSVPAQQFFFRYHVSEERDLPIMTDFAARVLHSLGSMRPEELAGYFGLEGEHARELIALLESESLIQRDGDRIQLSDYATIRFAASEDGGLRLTKMQPRQRQVLFDLLTYSHLPKDVGHHSGAYGLSLVLAEGTAIGETIDRAEKAFFDQFFEIDRKFDGKKAVALYKVESVEASRRQSLPVPILFYLNDEGRLDRKFDPGIPLPEALQAELSPLVSDTLAKAAVHMPSALSEFASVFGDEVVAGFVDRKGELDLPGYLREVHTHKSVKYGDESTTPVIGTGYLPERLTEFDQLLDKAKTSVRAAKRRELLWMIPDYELWGRTSGVSNASERLCLHLSNHSDSTYSVRWIRRDHPATKRWVSQLYDAGVRGSNAAQYSDLARRTEVIWVPGAGAYVVYYASIPDSDSVLVPVGFMTTDKARLRRVQAWITALLPSESPKEESPTDAAHADVTLSRDLEGASSNHLVATSDRDVISQGGDGSLLTAATMKDGRKATIDVDGKIRVRRSV